MNSCDAQHSSESTTIKAGKRSSRRRHQPYAWLGASALTLGVGVALAGAGTAHADDSPSVDSARSAKSSAASAPASRGPDRRAGDSTPAGSAAVQRAATPKATAAVALAGGRSAASVAQRTQGFAAPSGAATTAQSVGQQAPVRMPAGSDLVRGFILSRTFNTAQFSVGPIRVGGGVLASAYFYGHNGSATRLAGVISYVSSQSAKTPYGDPISGFTVSNATTGDTIAGQAVYGSGGAYEVAYYKSSSATTSPAAGYVLGSPVSDPTAAGPVVVYQPWPSNDAAYNSSPIYPSSGSKCEGYNTGSCANTPVTQTTTIAFNKAGYHPYGVETQIGTSNPTGTAYSTYSKVLYVANGPAGTITKIDPTRNLLVPPDKGGVISVAGNPTAVAVNPLNGYIYVANAATNKLQVINPTTNGIFEIAVGTNPTGLSVSSDGKKIFVANSGSGTVTMVDSGGSTPTNASAYKAVTLQTGGGQGTSGVAVAPSSDPSGGYTVFATNTISNTVSEINTDTKEVSTITGFNAPKGVVTSPEGNYVYVSNSGTNTVSVLGSRIAGTKVEVLNPSKIALSSDGRWAYVTSTTNNTVTVINTADNTVVQTYDLPAGSAPIGVSVDPLASAPLIAVANSGTNSVSVLLPNKTTGTLVPFDTLSYKGDPVAPYGLGFSSDGNYLFVTSRNAGGNSAVDVFNPFGGLASVPVPIISTRGEDATGLAVSPYLATYPSPQYFDLKMNYIYVTNTLSDTVAVIDPTTGEGKVYATGRNPVGVAVSPDGRYVMVSNTGSKTMSAFYAQSDAPFGLANITDAGFNEAVNPTGIAWSPDSTVAYVGNGFGDGGVSIVNQAGRTIDTIQTGDAVQDVAVSLDGRTLYTVNNFDNSVSAINIGSNATRYKIIKTLQMGDSPDGLAVAPHDLQNGTYYVFVAVSRDNSISAIYGSDSASPVDIYDYNYVADTIYGVTNNGSGPNTVAVVSGDGTGGKTLYTANTGNNSVSAVGWADSGTKSTPASDPAYLVTLNTTTQYTYDYVDNFPFPDYYKNQKYTSTATATCQTGSGAAGPCSVENTNVTNVVITFENPPGTNVYLDNTSEAISAAQANVLQNLVVVDVVDDKAVITNATFSYQAPGTCGTGTTVNFSGGVGCVAYSTPIIVPGTYVVGNTLPTSTYTNQSMTYSWASSYATSESTKNSTSTKAGFDLKLFEKLTLKAEETWGTETSYTTTDTNSFTGQLTVPIPPQYEAWLYESVPILRIYGSWTVTSGNTTYNLSNMWYNAPYGCSQVGAQNCDAGAVYQPTYYVASYCKGGDNACKDAVAGGNPSPGIVDNNGELANPWPSSVTWPITTGTPTISTGGTATQKCTANC